MAPSVRICTLSAGFYIIVFWAYAYCGRVALGEKLVHLAGRQTYAKKLGAVIRFGLSAVLHFLLEYGAKDTISRDMRVMFFQVGSGSGSGYGS